MLVKARRVRVSDFKERLADTVLHSPSLILTLQKTSKQSRFAVSISKKVVKGAVDRNRFRRFAYKAIQENLSNINDGALFFFSYKKMKEVKDFQSIKLEIEGLLRKSGYLQ